MATAPYMTPPKVKQPRTPGAQTLGSGGMNTGQLGQQQNQSLTANRPPVANSQQLAGAGIQQMSRDQFNTMSPDQQAARRQQISGASQQINQQQAAMAAQNQGRMQTANQMYREPSQQQQQQAMQMSGYNPNQQRYDPVGEAKYKAAMASFQSGQNPASGYGNGPQNTYNDQMSTNAVVPSTNPIGRQAQLQQPQQGNNVPRPGMQPQYGTNPVRPGTTPSSGPSWNLPTFNPSLPVPGKSDVYKGPPGANATHGGGSGSFWSKVDPWNTDWDDPNDINQVNTMLPVAQFDQNAYQYSMDFNEAKKRWEAEFGVQQNQNAFQQQLATQQQNAAQQQAAIAAAQWNQQFGHTQNMDLAGLGLSQQEINNTGAYQQGLVQNQANLNTAQGQFWQGQNQNDAFANQATAQYQQGLVGNQAQLNNFQNQYWQGQNANNAQQNQLQYQVGMGQNQAQQNVANTYAGAQNYAALLGLQEAQGYAGAQIHGANQGLAGQQYQANQQLAGQQYMANMGLQEANVYGGAQMYGSNQQLTGQKYMADQGYQEALAYANAQRYNTEAQERMNAAMMANNIAVSNINAYGRSPSVNTNWARSWS